MSFVYLGGEGGVKPTYFEVYAADKLVPSLKAAVIYSLSVFGQRRAWVQRLLDYEEEVFAVIALLLNRHSLQHSDATFAESLYGLKRESVVAQAVRQQQQEEHRRRSQLPGGAGERPPAAPRLNVGQRRWSLLLEVLLPYLQSKAQSTYQRHAPRPGVLGLAMARASLMQPQQPPQGASRGHVLLWRLRRTCLPALVATYPYVHAAIEAVRFAYQLGFLLQASPVHTPLLHLLRQRLVRVSGTELMDMEREKQQRRASRLAAIVARRPAALGWLLQGCMRAGFLVSDHARSALILGVFGFKILEWWYNSAEERVSAGRALPPPPPPKAPAPALDGVQLPDDPAKCPLCRRIRTNPAVVAVSGYAFCYPCAFNFVSEQRCCPVTRFPASLDHIRKVYEAM